MQTFAAWSLQQCWQSTTLQASHKIKFAKLHVEAALKAASEQDTIKAYYEEWKDDELVMDDDDNFESLYEGPVPTGGKVYIVDKDSILNAYPLTNIK